MPRGRISRWPGSGPLPGVFPRHARVFRGLRVRAALPGTGRGVGSRWARSTPRDGPMGPTASSSAWAAGMGQLTGVVPRPLPRDGLLGLLWGHRPLRHPDPRRAGGPRGGLRLDGLWPRSCTKTPWRRTRSRSSRRSAVGLGVPHLACSPGSRRSWRWTIRRAAFAVNKPALSAFLFWVFSVVLLYEAMVVLRVLGLFYHGRPETRAGSGAGRVGASEMTQVLVHPLPAGAAARSVRGSRPPPPTSLRPVTVTPADRPRPGRMPDVCIRSPTVPAWGSSCSCRRSS